MTRGEWRKRTADYARLGLLERCNVRLEATDEWAVWAGRRARALRRVKSAPEWWERVAARGDVAECSEMARSALRLA